MNTRYIFLEIVLFIVALSTTPLSGLAATYTVTNTNDSGPGSLREAIATANSTAADDQIGINISGCPNDVCMIVLTSGEFVIDPNSSAGKLAISNPSGPQSLIVSGNNNSRIFRALPGSNLTIDGMTLENGYAVDGTEFSVGGALRNEGSTNISHSVFRSNTGYSGGAIWNKLGSLVISRSEIINNRASSGAGIFSENSSLLVRDSTIANNIIDQCGGAFGGGIYFHTDGDHPGAQATLANSTISGNIASDQNGCGPFPMGAYGGGIYISSNFDGPVYVYFFNVTMTQNSAGVGGAVAGDYFVETVMEARNSIFSGNTAQDHADIADNTLSFYDLGNLIGQSALLGPLSNNGGPTRTNALLAGSPAINAGNNCVLIANGCGDGNAALPTDQRGLGRFGAVDIGAFELQGGCAYSFSADSSSFSVKGGTGGFDLTTNDAACSWTANSNATWITINSGAGTGDGSVAFTVLSNSSKGPRSGTINVGSQIFTVNQDAPGSRKRGR